MDILEQIAKELGLPYSKVKGTVSLLDEKNTIPFITRYRKEATGGLDEEQIRSIEERLQYLRSLEERKAEILEKIRESGKCTPELEEQISIASKLKTLEDLYLPFRPKKRTKATIAREKGLEPLAREILEGAEGNPEEIAARFIDPEKEIPDADSAWKGAMDIVAENVSENVLVRDAVRTLMGREGEIVSQKTSVTVEGELVYQDYFDYQEKISAIPFHRVLALDRGEKEGALRIKLDVAEEKVAPVLERICTKNPNSPLNVFLGRAIKDAYKRLIAPAISREIRNELTEKAHLHAVNIFASNLRNLLMQPPLKDMVILAIDPGYSSGCKLAVLSETGDLLSHDVIFPHPPQSKKESAGQKVMKYYKQYSFKAVVIGNGTASRETEEFISELIAENGLDLVYTITSEAGASVYSASEVAREEFPDMDASYRGTVSIGRRVLDPLAELVKIDTKSLGVGMYQHDVNTKLLEKALENVVGSVVNYVGVDVNRASAELLSYVAGINKKSARNIVSYRKKNGRFKSREALKKVSGIGPETFTQCAGFLRVNPGDNLLDNTAIHPESYPVCERLLALMDEKVENVIGRHALIHLKIKQFNFKELVKKLEVGEPTLRDIVDNLLKPGRDPREEVPPPIFRKGVLTLDDLKPDMVLDGTVRNVVDFGAFVDIGVKVDGLVHVSQMAKYFVKNPMEVCKVGDNVKVRVLSVDKTRNRISLSMV